MKKIFTLMAALMLLAFVPQVQAQTADDLLETVVDYGQDVSSFANANRNALNNLAFDYFQNGNNNPDVNLYLSLMDNYQQEIESASDEIYWGATQAASLSSCVDPSLLQSIGSQIEALEDDVRNESAVLANAIARGRRGHVRRAVRNLQGLLTQQIDLGNQAANEAAIQQSNLGPYNVRIELVDNNGNPVGSNGLQGYWGYDQATGQYFYPDYYTPDEFTGLTCGTYTFGAFDGYFDGASSETVTLDASLVGSDGFIVVQLTYWSE